MVFRNYTRQMWGMIYFLFLRAPKTNIAPQIEWESNEWNSSNVLNLHCPAVVPTRSSRTAAPGSRKTKRRSVLRVSSHCSCSTPSPTPRTPPHRCWSPRPPHSCTSGTPTPPPTPEVVLTSMSRAHSWLSLYRDMFSLYQQH